MFVMYVLLSYQKPKSHDIKRENYSEDNCHSVYLFVSQIHLKLG